MHCSRETREKLLVCETTSMIIELSIGTNLHLLSNTRTQGCLEKPQLNPQHKQLPVLSKKLFLVGKSGVGKTSTIDKLSGRGM